MLGVYMHQHDCHRKIRDWGLLTAIRDQAAAISNLFSGGNICFAILMDHNKPAVRHRVAECLLSAPAHSRVCTRCVWNSCTHIITTATQNFVVSTSTGVRCLVLCWVMYWVLGSGIKTPWHIITHTLQCHSERGRFGNYAWRNPRTA